MTTDVGKTALITGASSGIGRELAYGLAKNAVKSAADSINGTVATTKAKVERALA